MWPFGTRDQKGYSDNPGWRRTTGGGRGWYLVRKLAADPVPMTRQVRRKNERRARKMPIGMSQAEWMRRKGTPGKLRGRKVA